MGIAQQLMVRAGWAPVAFTCLVLIRLSFHVILGWAPVTSKLEGLLEIICLTPHFTNKETKALTG